jgi:hypothetical protein
MLELIKSFGAALLKCIIPFLASLLMFFGFYVDTSDYDLSQPQRISDLYEVSERRAIKKSVSSSIKVRSPDDVGMVTSISSGTYFVHGDKYYVITTAHGVLGNCDKLVVIYFEETSDCIDYHYINRNVDVAIIQIEKMKDRKPIRLPRNMGSKKNNYKLFDKVHYTGYPNNLGPLTIGGRIAGFTQGYVVLHSYAWSGSSGSGVFDERGDFIGIVVGIDVDYYMNGFTHELRPLEDVVVVLPMYKIDWKKIF